MKKVNILIMAALFGVMSLTACGSGDDGSGGEFNVVISSNPGNLDPQLAEDKESFYVIRNIYGTLMDIDGSGMIVNGTAQSYTVSSGGLTYTFKLREGLCWQGLSSSETVSLTAYDYEYAFRRIYDPQTHSPHTERFSDIKNSMAVYGGAMSSSQLGVKAVDELTLEITLEYPDCEFLKLMAHPAASPCNEQLFLSTRGRYGLAADATYACGAFYITDWNYDPYWHDNHITLEKISANSLDGYKTYPDIVNIEITGDRDAYSAENNISIDAYVIDDIAIYDRSVQKRYSCREYIDSTTCLFISPESPMAADEDVRRAVFSSVDLDKLAGELSGNSVQAFGFIPNAVTVTNKSFRDFYPESRTVLSASSAKAVWDRFTAGHTDIDFNSSILLADDSLNSESLPYSITSDLEDKLELYCSPVFEDRSDYKKRLESGDYDLCIAEIKGGTNSAEEFMQQIADFLPDGNSADELIKRADRCIDLSEKKDAVKAFEDYITDNAYALPLSFEKVYFISSDDTSDIWYDPFGETMFFKYAKQK